MFKSKVKIVRRVTSIILGSVLLGLIVFFFWAINSTSIFARLFRDIIQSIWIVMGPFIILTILLFIGFLALSFLISTRRQSLPSVNLKSKLLNEQITPSLLENNPQAAIEHAFTLFEDNLRKRINAGPEVFGENLINRAFGKNGVLTYGTVANEDRGIRDLMAGAYATLRNPRKHRIVLDNQDNTISIIALVDMLILLTDEAHNK